MNSQVRNTFTVLTLCSALVLGLLVVAPAAYPVADVAAAQSGTAVLANASRVGADAAIASLNAEAPAANPTRRKSGKTNRIRQSMAMPFFSFAPRG